MPFSLCRRALMSRSGHNTLQAAAAPINQQEDVAARPDDIPDQPEQPEAAEYDEGHAEADESGDKGLIFSDDDQAASVCPPCPPRK